jgi:YegS/Rv2252/BmrU family lipid kinase
VGQPREVDRVDGVKAGALVIVNPNASGGKLARAWPALAQRLKAAIGSFDVAVTRAQGDATDIARQAAREGYPLVVSVGGDGTNNEVVNGLICDDVAVNPATALGLLPFGTGGDLRRVLGLHTTDDALAALRAGYSAPVDVGRIDFVRDDGQPQSRYFLNIASFGVAGLVDRYVNGSRKPLGGRAAFLLATLQAMREYTYPTVTLQVDDGPALTTSIFNVAVANGQYFGGGMWVAPRARLDDGLLDVVVMQRAPLRQQLLRGLDIYKGAHVDHPWVLSLRGRQVTASGQGVLLDIDGEAPGRLPASLRVLPGVLALRQRAESR